MGVLVDVLRRVPLFRELADDDLTRLAARARERSYDRDAPVTSRGSSGAGFFIIAEGEAIVGSGARGTRLRKHDFFGEIALIDGGREDVPVAVEFRGGGPGVKVKTLASVAASSVGIEGGVSVGVRTGAGGLAFDGERELGRVAVSDDAPELALGLEHAGGGPAQAHLAGLPALDRVRALRRTHSHGFVEARVCFRLPRMPGRVRVSVSSRPSRSDAQHRGASGRARWRAAAAGRARGRGHPAPRWPAAGA
jgi:hypothetical protein